MEELGMSLNQEEFIDAAFRLYKSVSLPEKNILVQRAKSNSARTNQDDNVTFKPKIDPNSKRMAQKRI
jgi:hypothetical protein